MFNKGQRVACVDANLPAETWEFVKPLMKNGIYTIRDVIPGISIDGKEGNVAVYLEEILNTVNAHGIERGYNAERFAPLEEDYEEKYAIQKLPDGELLLTE